MNTKVLSFQTNGSLSIVELATEKQDTFGYISSAEALKKKLVEVTEVNEGGSVNNLFVINHSDQFVFFMDGDVLAGAKQNRVLNSSVLLAPNTKTGLPVSCVEAGRWHYKSRSFTPAEHITASKLRADKAKSVTKNLKVKNLYMADQGEVWDNVAKYQMELNAKSPTSNYSEIFEEKKEDFDKFTASFSFNGDANGIAVFCNNRLLNIDIFNRRNIYAEYFPRLLNAAAVDAYHLKPKNVVTEAEAKYKAQSFLDQFDVLQFEEHPGIGVGMEKRFNTNELTGFELSYESHLIHLAALNIKNE